MHSYQILDCDNYQSINEQLLDYVKKYTNLITNDPGRPGFDKQKTPFQYANFVNAGHFVKENPLMIKWLASYKLILRDVYFTLAWSPVTKGKDISSCPIHLDKPPVYWKLNWPILNMEQSAIRFFKLKDPSIDINTLVTRDGDPNSKDHDRYLLSYDDFDEIERHRFDQHQPVIMNGLVPHDVAYYENPVFPRIGVQIMFIKEPTHLL